MDIEKLFPTEFYNPVNLRIILKNKLPDDYEIRLHIYKWVCMGECSIMDYIFQYLKEIFLKPIVKTGQIAGFGSLHLACFCNKIDVVNKIVEEFHMDVNVVAEDGIQPIQLACLLGHAEIVKTLGEAGANINAEISHDMFAKYVKDKEWCNDFGNKMTLITYAIVVLHDNQNLIRVLIDLKSNLKIKSSRNKTLLMYLLQHDHFTLAGELLMNEEYREFINIRDADGLHFIHYILLPKKYGDYRYVGSALRQWDYDAGYFVSRLSYITDVDLYATINDNSDTLLLNIAAYRNSSTILKALLPQYSSIKKSKALYNATLLIEDPDKYFLPIPRHSQEEQLQRLEKQRRKSKKLILRDLINRLTFGLPIPEEEKTLMEKLISTDTETKEFVKNYEINFIEGVLKNMVIQYDDKSISHYDLILLSIDEVKLRAFVKNKTFMYALKNSINNNVPSKYKYKYYYFRFIIIRRMNATFRRIHLLKELKNISNLRKFIPVPYEWVLDIVDNLSNQDLETFIRAFYVKFSIKYSQLASRNR